MQPRQIREAHSSDQIRQWFNAADLDGNGTLSINEFFAWSLHNASVKYGQHALEQAFKKYDGDHSGLLDSAEFEAVCADMGFDTVAMKIFNTLDGDDSGFVAYKEVLDLAEKEVPTDPEVKGLLTALCHSFDEASHAESAKSVVEANGWILHGHDAATVQQELRAKLRESGGLVGDLVMLFDQDSGVDMCIDDIEFHSAMRERFGFKGPEHVLQEIFRLLDSDGSGTIGFDELFEFVQGHRHSLDHRSKAVREMRLEPPPGARYSLDDVQWDLESLRLLVGQMLERCQMGVGHLMAAWDKNGDRSVDRGEFVANMQTFFKGRPHAQDLWENEVEPIVKQSYAQISKCSSSVTQRVDMQALRRWLALPFAPDQQVRVKSRKMIRQRTLRRKQMLGVHEARIDTVALRKSHIRAAKAFAAERALPNWFGVTPPTPGIVPWQPTDNHATALPPLPPVPRGRAAHVGAHDGAPSPRGPRDHQPPPQRLDALVLAAEQVRAI